MKNTSDNNNHIGTSSSDISYQRQVLEKVAFDAGREHPCELCPRHELEVAIFQDRRIIPRFDATYASVCTCNNRYPDHLVSWFPLSNAKEIKSKGAKFFGKLQLEWSMEIFAEGYHTPVYRWIARSKATLKKNVQPRLGQGTNARLSKSSSHYLPLLVDSYGMELVIMRLRPRKNLEDIGSGIRLAKNRWHNCLMFAAEGQKNIFNDDQVFVDIGFVGDAQTKLWSLFRIVYSAYNSELDNAEQVQHIVLYDGMGYPCPSTIFSEPCAAIGVRYSESPNDEDTISATTTATTSELSSSDSVSPDSARSNSEILQTSFSTSSDSELPSQFMSQRYLNTESLENHSLFSDNLLDASRENTSFVQDSIEMPTMGLEDDTENCPLRLDDLFNPFWFEFSLPPPPVSWCIPDLPSIEDMELPQLAPKRKRLNGGECVRMDIFKNEDEDARELPHKKKDKN